MAAIDASAPATALDSSSRSLVALVGLTALASGVSMLLVGVMLPALHSHPVAIIAAEANQAAAAPLAVRQDVAQVPEDSPLIASRDPFSVAHRAGPITTHDHRNAEQSASVRPGLDLRGGSPRPSPCLKTDLERGTRAESAPLATIPLKRDPREVLITLVAAQHGGPGTWSGPCLMRRLTVQDPGHVDSDDRIANALVAPAPVSSPQRRTGPR
jgi:hypothetical protein